MSLNIPTTPEFNLLLSLPSEIRLDIYKQFFQSTNVTIHRGRSIAGRHVNCPSTPKYCLNLLRINKLIRQEATSLFFKETMFLVPGCCCWFSSTLTNFVLPVDIGNITIQSIQDGNDPASHIREAVAALEDRFARTTSMVSSLVCEPPLEEQSMFIHGIKNMFNGVPRMVQFLTFDLHLTSKETNYSIRIENRGGTERTFVTCTQDMVDDFKEFVKSYNLGLTSVMYRVV